jgi:hypothetical protein
MHVASNSEVLESTDLRKKNSSREIDERRIKQYKHDICLRLFHFMFYHDVLEHDEL